LLFLFALRTAEEVAARHPPPRHPFAKHQRVKPVFYS